MDEITGTLASGSRYRVTPHEVEVVSEDNALGRYARSQDLVGVRRAEATVHIREYNGRNFDLVASSTDDAVAIERMLLRTIPAIADLKPTPFRVELNSVTVGITACIIFAIVVVAYIMEQDYGILDRLGF